MYFNTHNPDANCSFTDKLMQTATVAVIHRFLSEGRIDKKMSLVAFLVGN